MLNPIKEYLKNNKTIKSKVWWANFGQFSHYIDTAIPMANRPVLIISMPRSGSTWVGEILGSSEGAMYLREPINQTNQKALDDESRKPIVCEVTAKSSPKLYLQACDTAFRGIPAFDEGIVPHPEQFSLNKRKEQTLIVKEVNPLGISWFIDKYRPKIIYLLRHPAAVAYSFYSLGWAIIYDRKKLDEVIFPSGKDTLDRAALQRFSTSFWSFSGAFQAIVAQHTMKILNQYDSCKIFRYEDLCLNPEQKFREMYQFCGLPWDEAVQERLSKTTTSGKSYRPGEYSLNRNSSKMIEQWRTQIDAESLTLLKDAYLHYSPAFFQEPQWW